MADTNTKECCTQPQAAVSTAKHSRSTAKQCRFSGSAAGKRKILVVDDEPDVVEIIRFFLSEAGYEVTSAVSGQEAIKKAREIGPDLITLDIKMPMMDGLQVASALRENLETKKTPIMAISIVGDELEGKEGIDESLCKPFTGEELLSRVKKLLREGRRAATEDSGG